MQKNFLLFPLHGEKRLAISRILLSLAENNHKYRTLSYLSSLAEKNSLGKKKSIHQLKKSCCGRWRMDQKTHYKVGNSEHLLGN